MPSGLTFDPATHTYRLDGKVIPSVTQVLRGAGIIHVSDFCTGPERGSLVHRACALLDMGMDDELQVLDGLPEILPYLEAWQQLKGDVWPSGEQDFTKIEAPGYITLSHGSIAGTPDRVTGSNYIFDIKTGAWQWGYDVQLVAYRHIEGKHITELSGVQLTPGVGAGYKLHRVDKKKYMGYWNLFQKALEIHNAKQSEGKFL